MGLNSTKLRYIYEENSPPNSVLGRIIIIVFFAWQAARKFSGTSTTTATMKTTRSFQDMPEAFKIEVAMSTFEKSPSAGRGESPFNDDHETEETGVWS